MTRGLSRSSTCRCISPSSRREGGLIRLFTTAYPEAASARRAELLECLRRNVACAAISEICILVEGDVDFLPDSPKTRTRTVGARPTYNDFFSWIAEAAAVDDLSIIANSDIWFDESITVANRVVGSGDCFALARWSDGRLFDRNDSQDAWIFRGRINGVRGDFPIGVPRCDNRLLYELQEAGYRVTNPAFSIRAHHLHAGHRPAYSAENTGDFVAPPYRYTWPDNLWSLPRTLWHNALHPAERIGWRLDRRRVKRTFPFRAIGRIRRMASRVSASDGTGTTRR
jgi:hypothetical protein